MPKIGKLEKTKRDQGVLKGLPKLMRGRSTIDIATQRLTEAQIRARVQEHLDAMAKVAQATIALRLAVQEERKVERSLRLFLAHLKLVAQGLVGRRSVALLELGFKPDKKPYMSAETRRRANEKRQKTRLERGIIGKRRRKRMGR